MSDYSLVLPASAEWPRGDFEPDPSIWGEATQVDPGRGKGPAGNGCGPVLAVFVGFVVLWAALLNLILHSS